MKEHQLPDESIQRGLGSRIFGLLSQRTVEENRENREIIPDSLNEVQHAACLVPICLVSEEAPAVEPSQLRTRGTIELENGNYYTGELMFGLPYGEGRLVNHSQTELLYQGSFRRGLYHGKGTQYNHNQIERNGRFEDGLLVEGRYKMPSGAIQIGKFNRNGNLTCEQGRLVLPSGGYLIGKWNDGKPLGPFTVFLGAGRVPMKYDFSKKDENTKFGISIHNDFIFYDDRYLLSAGAVFLYYFNGDIFVGTTNSRSEPMNGIYYHLVGDQYYEMILGNKLEGCDIVLEYSPECAQKNCLIRV